MKKMICFHTGCSVLINNQEATIEKLNSAVDTFIEKKDSTHVIWCGDQNVENILNSSVGSPKLHAAFYACIERFEKSGVGEYIPVVGPDEMVAKCDAYYGDCGYLMGQFIQAGKPCMQMDL